jgi:hypothetical protein
MISVVDHRLFRFASEAHTVVSNFSLIDFVGESPGANMHKV